MGKVIVCSLNSPNLAGQSSDGSAGVAGHQIDILSWNHYLYSKGSISFENEKSSDQSHEVVRKRQDPEDRFVVYSIDTRVLIVGIY